ncbi:TetR family transcriptional regulator [Pendulispora brunnea]|uniref:TetR family transcriptional regulator n=1 Tax=Pendulispora brunnea TaxID=2905690 RepID=A0ABZ2KB65_9BACT
MARPRADPTLLRQVAIAVFGLVADHGIDGTSMRAVAAATGLSTGTLNYHFENKRGLIRFALSYAYQPPPDWSAHEGDTGSALRRLFQRYLLQRDQVRVWWRFWCAITAAASSDPEMAEWQMRTHQALVGFFAAVLGPAERRGELASRVDADAEAERLVALAHGLALRQLVDPRPEVFDLCKSLLEQEIERVCTSRTDVRL